MPDGMCGTSWTIVTGWAFTLYDIVPPAVTINSGSVSESMRLNVSCTDVSIWIQSDH